MSGLGVLAPGVQFRRPATLLPYRGVLRVGARNRAGPLGSGGRTFSSGTSLASPSVRKSFLLRDFAHGKSQIRNDSILNEVPNRRPTSGVIVARSYRCPPLFGWRGMAGDGRGIARIADGRPRADISLPPRCGCGPHERSLCVLCGSRSPMSVWRPSGGRQADRRNEWRAGIPGKSGSFCQLTVTAN